MAPPNLKKNINTNIYVAQKTDAMAFHLGDELTLIVDFAPCRITIGTKTTFKDYMYNDRWINFSNPKKPQKFLWVFF